MHRQRLLSHRLHNTLQTLLLLGGMGGLLVTIGWLTLRGPGIFLAVALALGFLVFGSPLSGRWILRLYRARPLSRGQAPELFAMVGELARRAELPRPPGVHYIPSQVLNAFAVGSGQQAAIGLTDGLLRRLQGRELAGVLAHEVGHIRNGDLRVMALADFISRLTSHFALLGQFLLFLYLPLGLLGMASVPLVLIVVLLVAPVLSTVLQLALSRTREFAADLEAVQLTGDPQGLASALARMGYDQEGWIKRILLPGRRNPAPSYLRTHPDTEERIRRLESLVEGQHAGIAALGSAEGPFLSPPQRAPRGPRWRVSGLWY